MIKFSNKIVQFGFGAVGKSFFEKIKHEIDYNENNYYVLTREDTEFEAFINLGGIAQNFFISDINKDNYKSVFDNFLNEGDILIDFADTVGTRDICEYCISKKVMYLNTGETDWPDNWYSIFKENNKKHELQKEYKDKIKYPIVLHHGNNPGLVSHFTKAALEYVVTKQFKNDKELHKLLKDNKFNEIAEKIKLRMIHVNDIDTQIVKELYTPDKLISTWCCDSFFFELLSEATQNIGTHEILNDEYKMINKEKGYLEYKSIARNTVCKTYYPNGYFEGYLVPHEETITIADNLTVKDGDKTIYRPSVMFIYSPCSYAKRYLIDSKVNNYPNSDPNLPQDIENPNGISIVRGHIYPNKQEIVYKEKIEEGTEYVGILLIGESFNPVWVGNRIEPKFLYKSKDSYWQTPTITPVAMSALSALKWMINNKDKGAIYFPDDIEDYKYIIKSSEKYISKTIYKTFTKEQIEESLNIKLDDIQSSKFITNKKE